MTTPLLTIHLSVWSIFKIYIYVFIYDIKNFLPLVSVNFFELYKSVSAAVLGKWSECLATNQEIVGSFPGTFTIIEVDYVWNSK